MAHRVQFDFEIDFSNGGGIQGQDFRLDIAGDDIAERQLADYLVADLRLLMVGAVRIRNKRIVVEAHKRIAPGAGSYVDLSHRIEHGTLTHRGLPGPIICDYLTREASRERYAPGYEFQIARVDMVVNTGTYIDCPFHRFAHGKDWAQMAIDSCTGLDAVVIRAAQRNLPAVGVEQFRDHELRGRAVLVHTGWDRRWNTPEYFGVHPFLTEEAALYLRDCGVKLVGIDAMNIDDTRGGERPAHTALLGAEILIVEHLTNLAALPDEGFAFTALPPKFAGVGTFPVRAFAKLLT
jgi:kynurenine formamidase